MLIFLSLIFTGCASIEYQRVINTDGSIVDAVAVKLDVEKITNAGYNKVKVTNDIKIKMTGYINSIVNSFIIRDDNLSSLDKSAVINNTQTLVSESDTYIVASIKFNNYATFKYFYGLHLNEETNNDDIKIVKDFLVTKSISTGKTIFSGANAEFIANEFLAYFDNNFTIEDANLSYVFGTTENKMYSDATYHFTLNDVNFHQWVITDVNQEISTYTLTARPINWYLLGLALTFGLIIILFVISLFKKQTKKEVKQ